MSDPKDKIKVKLQLLHLTQSKTKAIVDKGNLEKIRRHKEALVAIITAVEELKRDAEEAELEKGESVEEIEKWGQEIEQQVDQADVEVDSLQRCLKEAVDRTEDEKRHKEEKFLAKQRVTQLNFEKEQWEQKKQLLPASDSEKTTSKSPEAQRVKLPKLVITKYDGKLTNWLAFWNKFETEIDKTDLPAVTKFAYLKELVEPSVRRGIDGLPFTVEGYQRAKNILKTNYGKTSEILNAYVENIRELPVVSGSNPADIHNFYETLTFNVQSLETLGKITECWSMVREVLDKLPGVKAQLVQGQVDWQMWGFSQLLDALHTWKEIHPIVKLNEKPPKLPPRHRSLYGRENTIQQRKCVYCDDPSHKSVDCTTIATSQDRKKWLMGKGLCFNCTGTEHRASNCRSRWTCGNCKQKHHTSICDQASKPKGGEHAMTATHQEEKVYHPVVIVKVHGVKCRALLDTGATSTYISAFLVDLLKLKPSQTLTRGIKTIVGHVTRRIETYNVKISDTRGKCVLPVCATKVDRKELLTLDNPNYPEILKKYAHLKGVHMEETATKRELPIHVILGANEYTKIKTSGYQRAGSIGQPVAEHTRFGWTIMSTGTEADLQNMFFAQTDVGDYEKLCRLDVLGIQDSSSGDQSVVHGEFLEQLQRSQEGWYVTGLPWKGNHPPLPNNKVGSLKRLESLVKRLKRTGKMDAYNEIIREQLEEGVVEKADLPPEGGREFYIPHKAVLRESSETTKMRIVYDASARASESDPSLNDCLEIGPPLQNQLWKVLVRGRFHAVAIAGDIKKAFLQVRIRAEDRDALRFHWIDSENPEQVRTLRFTRALFGLGPSPFLLGGVIQHHLNGCRTEHRHCVEEIERGLYVDDLLTGSQTIEEARELKTTVTAIFGTAKFELHKWNSNVRELEIPDQSENEADLSYAKQQLGECGLLGLKWDKQRDTIAVSFPQEAALPTKRSILAKIAKVYDPLGLVAPLSLQGKLLYRAACEEKCAWDAKLPEELVKRWNKWETSLPERVEIPRSLVAAREPVESVALHAFGDASGHGVAAVVYAVVEQQSKVSQGLVVARARLAKHGLTIPRLELVAGHMAVNLLTNVNDALVGFPVKSLHAWLDSTVALHWIRGSGEYKQFVGNRVHKIQEHEAVVWRHVPTKENPADLASRGGPVDEEKHLWWNGPAWLKDSKNWPPDIVTTSTPESSAERKATKQIFALAIDEQDDLDDLLDKTTLWRTLRVSAWIGRFLFNSRVRAEERRKGQLTTAEINAQKVWWEKRIQQRDESSESFSEDRMRLNLQMNQKGLLQCMGRIQGHYPVYLPDTSTYARKFVQHAHQVTLHGGASLTMAKVREEHWIPRLRRLCKRVIKECAGCKRFQAVAFANPPPGLLPRDRTEGSTPFEVVGVYYAGPLIYQATSKKQGKAYILLYSCSLTRALHLELLPTLETQDFIRSLKRFIARRGRPKKVYSDNGRTFVGASGWLRLVMRDEKWNDFLARSNITWQFNLSRAPWWGGQFERLVGLVKRSLYKSIGRGLLSWQELEEVLLDVEVALNGRPLSYVEEDVQMPILTPNALLYPQANLLPELKVHHVEDPDLRKRARHLERCKQAVWSRWTKEYVRALRERHNQKHNNKKSVIAEGDVVIIQGDEKNRNQWKLGIIIDLIVGKDGIVRAAKLRAGKGVLERAIQHLYPLELSCDKSIVITQPTLDPGAAVFRPQRDAAVAGRLRVKQIISDEQ